MLMPVLIDIHFMDSIELFAYGPRVMAVCLLQNEVHSSQYNMLIQGLVILLNVLVFKISKFELRLTNFIKAKVTLNISQF